MPKFVDVIANENARYKHKESESDIPSSKSIYLPQIW